MPHNRFVMVAAAVLFHGCGFWAPVGQFKKLNSMVIDGIAKCAGNFLIMANVPNRKPHPNPNALMKYESKRPVDIAIRMMQEHPARPVAKIRTSMINAGVEVPSLSMFYRWRKTAGIVRHLENKTTRVEILPVSQPGYVVKTECGLRAKRSHVLSNGTRIYIVEDLRRGNKRTVQSSFLNFLDWLEQYTGKPIEITNQPENNETQTKPHEPRSRHNARRR